MEKIKPIDLMEKCPVCGETPVFGHLCTENDGTMRFNVHCPNCGCKVPKIYLCKMTFSYTGNFGVSSEAQFAVDDWNDYVNSIKDQFKKENRDSRTSISFTDDVYEFVKTMARFKGETMSDFVNNVLEKEMSENGIYKQLQEIKKAM